MGSFALAPAVRRSRLPPRIIPLVVDRIDHRRMKYNDTALGRCVLTDIANHLVLPHPVTPLPHSR